MGMGQPKYRYSIGSKSHFTAVVKENCEAYEALEKILHTGDAAMITAATKRYKNAELSIEIMIRQYGYTGEMVDIETAKYKKLDTNGEDRFKQAVLTSLEPEKYPDTTVNCKVIDDPEHNLDTFTDKTQPPILARKQCEVWAYKARLGEKITTAPIAEVQGKKYRLCEVMREITEEDVAKGAMIIQNPDGEIYPMNGDDFLRQFGDIQNNGLKTAYKSLGSVKPFLKATDNVCIAKPTWGEGVYQFILQGSMVNIEKPSSPKGITNVAFENTYQTVNEKQNEPELTK
jgi:hypothetical protein